MAKSLTIPQLAERCQAEAERYQQSGQSDERYCFELFRRALTKQDAAAWEAIYRQYQRLVKTWVQRYSRFRETEEGADFLSMKPLPGCGNAPLGPSRWKSLIRWANV